MIDAEPDLTTSWTYKNNNWLDTQTLENGATATYSYNSLGQVTRLLNQISATTISDFSGIAYDGVGNRTSVTASIPGTPSLSGTTSYTYDSKNQLTQETSTRNGGFTDSFGYDSAGSPTSFKGATKSYNSNNQQTGTDFIYDGNGNPTTYAGITLTFDPENHLSAYGSGLTAAYNGDGLRAWKQSAGARTYFLYDATVPVIELDANGNVLATTSFAANGLSSRRTASTSVFYSFDSEGNLAQRSDDLGTVLSNSLFDSHGASLAGSFSEPFGYKAKFGYYTDSEAFLQLLTERYYDPAFGRFLTRDPVGYGGGINLYSYTNNNPENSNDPDGLSGSDRWYGYNNRDFHRWFHRCWKQPGDADATKEEIEEAYDEWVSRGSPSDGNCWGSSKKTAPSTCNEPATARNRVARRYPGPSLDEFRLLEESNRQMETFWTKVLVGDAIVGAVLLAPEGAVVGAWRFLTRVPVPIRP